ncbi:unnamed protein product [Albugo candida]|uniref:Uncharacterized protein n=1 Tax=Albugo candida TaxID=65357 RepID=A0A024FUX7_9STRA|nr:unnamed protein product [Albugo candida]|eukprot:CCI10925.1 unnamed protein product [Albugo candida]
MTDISTMIQNHVRSSTFAFSLSNSCHSEPDNLMIEVQYDNVWVLFSLLIWINSCAAYLLKPLLSKIPVGPHDPRFRFHHKHVDISSNILCMESAYPLEYIRPSE